MPQSASIHVPLPAPPILFRMDTSKQRLPLHKPKPWLPKSPAEAVLEVRSWGLEALMMPRMSTSSGAGLFVRSTYLSFFRSGIKSSVEV